MTGFSNYTADNVLNQISSQLAYPALASSYIALFTAVGTDAGTGFTEVSTGSYARVQCGGALTTNGTTASGNPTLHFASVPAWIVAGMTIRDTTTSSVIPAATTVLSTTGTTVTMSANATGGGVGGTDVIQFTAFPAATGTGPASITSGAALTFPAATGSWGTIIAFGLYDASTSGNLLAWDYLGNNTWNPFTCTSASPGVLTSPAHGYSNGDSVVVTAEYGGTLPTTGGSWAGLLTVASSATDTFTAGVNTTGTGDGLVRKVVSQSIPSGVTASFASSAIVITAA